MRKIFTTLSFALSVAAMAGACAQVPDLDVATESVRIVDVVKRVKCDIYDAFTVDTPNGRRLLSQQKGYDWLNDWTAQVDLNLLVNHQSGLTPGATFIDPLHQVVIPRVGNFSQSFSLGLGGGVNTTAARTETITFSLSVKEIEAELRNPSHKSWAYQNCQFVNGAGLRSDLKLREWIASALTPADADRPYLTAGYHKTQRGGGAAAAKKGGSRMRSGVANLSTSYYEKEPRISTLALGENGRPVAQLLKDIASLMDNIRALNERAPDRELNRQIASMTARIEAMIKFIERLKNDRDIGEIAKPFNGPAGLVEHLRTNAIILSWITRFGELAQEREPSLKKIENMISSLNNDINQISGFFSSKEIQDALDTLEKAKDELTKVKAGLDPPIDSISHQVQFILSFNGNASPGWTLVRFRGPGPSNGLVSGSQSNTHTLTIVMGSSAENVSGRLNALQIGTNIGNALNTTTVRVAPVQ